MQHCRPDEVLSFYDLMKRGREKHEIVIGYKSMHAKRPTVNPPAKDRRNLSLADIEAVVVMSHMAVARACFHRDTLHHSHSQSHVHGTSTEPSGGNQPEISQSLSYGSSASTAALPPRPPRTPFD